MKPEKSKKKQKEMIKLEDLLSMEPVKGGKAKSKLFGSVDIHRRDIRKDDK